MEQVFECIFQSLKSSENAIKDISSILKRQDKINKRIGMFSIAAIAWAYSIEKQRKKDKEDFNKEIEKLNCKLTELKYSKGEPKM